MQPAFAELVKAHVVHNASLSHTALRYRVLAARRFYLYLLYTEQVGADHEWSWPSLEVPMCVQGFEAWMLARDDGSTEAWSRTQRARLTGSLLAMLRWMMKENLLARFSYSPRTKRERSTGARKEAAARTEELIQAAELIADAREGKRTPPETVVLAVLAILMATGLRVGEVLTLPYDCERWQRIRRRSRAEIAARGGTGDEWVPSGSLTNERPPDADRDRFAYALRYCSEKAPALRWRLYPVTPTAAPLVEWAVDVLRKELHDARGRARILSESPGIVPLPFRARTPRATSVPYLRVKDIAQWMGVQTASLHARLRRAEVPSFAQPLPASHRRRGQTGSMTPCVAVADFQAYVAARRSELPSCAAVLPDGSRIELHEALLVVFDGFFQGRSKDRVRRSLLVRPVSVNALSKVLERLVQEGTTHRFRHLLNRVGFENGLSVTELTALFGRNHRGQTWSYIPESSQRASIERSADELAAFLREQVLANSAVGPLVEAAHTLPMGERANLLVTHLQVAYTTPWGFCTRFDGPTQCPIFMACVQGACEHYLGERGNVEEIAALEEQLVYARLQIDMAIAAASRGEQWGKAILPQYRTHLRNIEVALSWHRSPDIAVGTRARVFAGRALPVLS